MFRSVFKPYGLVWNLFNTITDVLGLSLLWCLCSLPLFTLGAATTALYDAAVHGIRFREDGTYRRFFRTFRAELKTTIPVTLLWCLILAFCSYVLAFLTEAGEENTAAALMAGAYCLLMLFPIAAMCWSFAILSRFTYNFRSLTGTAVQFVFLHLPSSAFIAAVAWAGAWFCHRYWLPLTFAPAVVVLVWSLPAERIFGTFSAAEEQPVSDE